MINEKDLVKIAKRENNIKRTYLVVNPSQGKHMPVKPHAAMELFWALGDKVKAAYPGERLLLIGFAETATAVGAAIASQLGASYMQTTRERVPGADYLFFSEEHSHATEQKLVKEDFRHMADLIQRIVFVEDEITTGNTIMNIIALLKKTYPMEHISFSAASLLNGMDEIHRRIYMEHEIETLYLLKTDHKSYEAAAKQAKGDGGYITPQSAGPGTFTRIPCSGYVNARRLVEGGEYQTACESLWNQIQSQTDFTSCRSILILGTEEFMYPALYAAYKIEALGKQVRFHATTRSPIVVSSEPDYPLHERYCLSSFYENGRNTYVYDLRQYDKALVITDGAWENEEGMRQLANALVQNGTGDIVCIVWKEE